MKTKCFLGSCFATSKISPYIRGSLVWKREWIVWRWPWPPILLLVVLFFQWRNPFWISGFLLPPLPAAARTFCSYFSSLTHSHSPALHFMNGAKVRMLGMACVCNVRVRFRESLHSGFGASLTRIMLPSSRPSPNTQPLIPELDLNQRLRRRMRSSHACIQWVPCWY